MVKNIIFSIIIGLIAYEVSGFVTGVGLRIPVSGTEIALLVVFIATAFIGSILSGSTAAVGDGRELGTVKWFNVRKGYGFITRDQGDDIFVHFRNIEGGNRRAISEGQRVSFLVTEGDKGLQADKVEPA